MKIIPLSEGSFTVDQTKQFVPFSQETDDLQQRSKGSLLVEIQPFAIITSRDILVLDTGLGFMASGQHMQIHNNLAAHNIGASEVSRVLLSHLHKDHSGGIARPGKKDLTFPNATYYINRQEWEYAFQNNSASYITADFEALRKSGQLQFTEGSGSIDNYIQYEMTGAHSPFHQVFWIEEEGEKIFFGGDVAPQLQQMKNRFKAKYDYDGASAMELRQKWWMLGEQEKWSFLFYHDIKCPVYKFDQP
jgi:glyoxylase-like metal-dependent hydrolase (beta-lactamase superfamily II)